MAKKKKKTVPFDAAEYLDTPESQAELITDALESGDAAYIAQAIGVVARARGMTAVAKDAGVTREALSRPERGRRSPPVHTGQCS